MLLLFALLVLVMACLPCFGKEGEVWLGGDGARCWVAGKISSGSERWLDGVVAGGKLGLRVFTDALEGEDGREGDACVSSICWDWCW